MKKKLSYIPNNLFMCIFSFFVMFVFLNTICNVSITISLIASAWFYIYEVAISSNRDYMEDRIKKLENDKKEELDSKIKELENKIKKLEIIESKS